MSQVGDPRGVFYDIADTEEEAANCTARGQVMIGITKKIQAEGWTQTQAAEILNVPRARVAALLKGKLSEFSLDDLVGMLGPLWLTLDVRPIA